jgi:predicted phage baseplate assembly protein
MKRLAPNLFDRRFQSFVEIGRARLRPLAPDWTDHNAHDPGITLMELLAWVAEAQLYSVSRLRRDERAAYAALLGLETIGTTGARGLIWPDRSDPGSPSATFARSAVIPDDAVVRTVETETPTFRPTHTLLWTPGRIVRLETRQPDGSVTDHTAMNARGGPVFLPFGDTAGSRVALALTFECRDDDGVFGTTRQLAPKALWAVGVRAADLNGSAAEAVTHDRKRTPRRSSSPLIATIVAGNDRVPVTIVSDTTDGLLETGVLLLDLSSVAISPKEFTLELRAPRGLARPPRVLGIEPNVVPVRQGRAIIDESHDANGRPDWRFTLESPGLRFGANEEPIALRVPRVSGLANWRRVDDFAAAGPNDDVYALDTRTGEVTFGNGLNGRMPPLGSQVFVSYAVSDGAQGNVARNRQWRVEGFAGVFGVNPDPMAGGMSPSGSIDDRREARRRSRDEHALVSASDIAAAARSLPLLEVGRAWVVPPSSRAPRTGTVKLVAMRSRPGGREPAQAPETGRWLDAIRRHLLDRMPLGTRLLVTAPHYAEFTIDATLEVDPGRDPRKIRDLATDALRRRLALVAEKPGTPVRPPGVPVTHRDVAAWLRSTDGVRRVVRLRLLGTDGRPIESVAVSPGGLPRWNADGSTLDVASQGSAA